MFSKLSTAILMAAFSSTVAGLTCGANQKTMTDTAGTEFCVCIDTVNAVAAAAGC